MRPNDYRNDDTVAALVAAITARHPDVRAVLLYGSYLRGKRDTLLDFYVLVGRLDRALPGFWQRLGNRWLPPNVYHLALAPVHGVSGPRCKYALVTLAQFERAMVADFHSYFWSRFTQPCVLVHSDDAPATPTRVAAAIAAATRRFVAETAPTFAGPFDSEALWRRGLALSYACELRAEPAERVAALYHTSRRHFDTLLDACARAPDPPIRPAAGAAFRYAGSVGRTRAQRRWAVRRYLGKLLSVARLVKAAATFEDPLDYLLWKIERHSGVCLPASPRQRRYPLLFAWGLLWRLYRRGAFR